MPNPIRISRLRDENPAPPPHGPADAGIVPPRVATPNARDGVQRDAIQRKGAAPRPSTRRWPQFRLLTLFIATAFFAVAAASANWLMRAETQVAHMMTTFAVVMLPMIGAIGVMLLQWMQSAQRRNDASRGEEEKAARERSESKR